MRVLLNIATAMAPLAPIIAETRSLQSEPKALLSALFTLQRENFKEHGTYLADFKGLEQIFEGRIQTVVGFAEKCRKGSEVLNNLQIKERNGWYFSQSQATTLFAEEFLREASCAPEFPNTWEAYAVYEARPTFELWSYESPFVGVYKIDEKKNLIEIRSKPQGNPFLNWYYILFRTLIVIIPVALLIFGKVILSKIKPTQGKKHYWARILASVVICAIMIFSLILLILGIIPPAGIKF